MDEIENPNEPKTVLQLNYAGRENETLRLVLRAVATLFVIWQFNQALNYLFEFGSYLWEQNDLTVRNKLLPGITVALRTPSPVEYFVILSVFRTQTARDVAVT